MPDYGSWIRARRLYGFGLAAVLCLAAATAGIRWPVAWLLVLPGLVLVYITWVVALTHYRLSARGSGYQARIHGIVVARVGASPGLVLDVGCGSGSLAVRVARSAPQATVLGVDSWRDDWGYSARQCESNAAVEGVAGRVLFQRADAAHLPFDDAVFDTVVSCMTFHEVRSLPDRTDAVRESLRVLRPGGRFVFLDLFSDPAFFTSPDHIDRAVRESGCVVVDDDPLGSLLKLPHPLGSAKVLGHARLMEGHRPERR